MNVIIFSILVVTVLQLIICHFSLWWLIVLICRLLFMCRIIGATFKVKNLAIGEGVAIAAMLIFDMLFAKGMPWLRILFFILFSLISVGLMFLDDILYVYTIEDVDDD